MLALALPNDGPAARVAGFLAHLRRNGFAVGPGEAEIALDALAAGSLTTTTAARLGFKIILCGGRAEWERFDPLFDAFWLGRGIKTVERAKTTGGAQSEHRHPRIWE